jgi:hypothetical protein
MGKTIYSETNRLITADGEIVTVELKTVRKITKEKFLQVYLEDFASLMSINEGVEYKIILWIGKHMNYETNEMILVKANKETMSNDIGANIRTVNNAIGALTKKKILISEDRSIFTLNPKLFFKGSVEQRQTLIRTVEYQIKDENEQEIQSNSESE